MSRVAIGADELRAVISTPLAATPIDEKALRRGAWTFVGTEREADASSDRLPPRSRTSLAEAWIAPAAGHQARVRRVMRWCVELYFGQLDDDILGRADDAFGDVPRLASSR
jgi:hypothetical protein